MWWYGQKGSKIFSAENNKKLHGQKSSKIFSAEYNKKFHAV
jgi:hypothetical protein